jgi:hypothetical protein
MFYNYLCEYRKAFPVDEYGRLVVVTSKVLQTKVLQRLGVVFAENSVDRLLHVRDKEHPAWQFWVPYSAVDIDLHIKREVRACVDCYS